MPATAIRVIKDSREAMYEGFKICRFAPTGVKIFLSGSLMFFRDQYPEILSR
jgi:hypothetical protein